MNISVIIPSFRSGGYLLEAVQSVLNQRGDFELQEIIVVDDDSDDSETHDAYKKLISEPRVKLIKNQEKKKDRQELAILVFFTRQGSGSRS